MIQFNQKEWLKPYTELGTELQRNAMKDPEKYFLNFLTTPGLVKSQEMWKKLGSEAHK